MIEAIIGREHGSNRLVMSITGGKVVPLSAPGVVPNTVSSKHCQLKVDDDGVWTLVNIKSALYTYVNGMQIESKRIQPDSRVELGVDHFAVDMPKVKKIVGDLLPKVYSIKHLQTVWDEYHGTQLKMQLDEKRKNTNRMLTGVLSPISMILFILPMVMNTEMPPIVNALRLILAAAMALMALYFYIQSRRGLKNDIILRMDRLNDEFQQKYLCPNPDCHHFLGNQSYRLLTQHGTCPYCRCKFQY